VHLHLRFGVAKTSATLAEFTLAACSKNRHGGLFTLAYCLWPSTDIEAVLALAPWGREKSVVDKTPATLAVLAFGTLGIPT
jgi:hypothetical protein